LASKSLEFKNHEDTRPIKLFFQDEARFGRIDNTCSCWVPSGGRALVAKQIIKQYIYLYGAFCPETMGYKTKTTLSVFHFCLFLAYY
jgi:hypothetical protein